MIYFGNVAAGLFAPTVFLHFCLTFPETPRWLQKKARVALLYVPAAVLFADLCRHVLGIPADGTFAD